MEAKKERINPTFTPLNSGDILEDAASLVSAFEPIEHKKILDTLLSVVEKIDYQALAFPQAEFIKKEIKRLENELRNPDGSFRKGKEAESISNNLRKHTEDLESLKVKQKHYIIITIDAIIELALKNNWGICKSHDFVYLYNGAYWGLFDNDELQVFFGKAAEKMGVGKWEAKFYVFREQLFKQFLAVANLPKPEPLKKAVLINLKNGTFEISPENQELRPPERKDFITYQLPFEYNPKAKCSSFIKYLNTVQPDIERQKILAEYVAYVFISSSVLKLEKVLLLYGSGANGKSVFFDIVYALLGHENISSYSLQSLTDIERGGPYRAKIANKLLNYASEISGKLETSIFKAMVSGEPIEAKALYSQPFQITEYAKLIFNCNQLPKDTEQTDAFFRRFLIIPFDIKIPEKEQDKELAKKIINAELSGVFNWVLEGLKRLLHQKKFTHSDAANKQIEEYKKQSDSVQMFIEDEGYKKSSDDEKPLKDFFKEYKNYCNESGYSACSVKTISDRLRNSGFEVKRVTKGNIVRIKKEIVI